MYDYQKEQWTWTDDSDFNYSNWNPGEPNYDAGKHANNCIEMYSDDELWGVVPGGWNDLSCSAGIKQHVGICKKPANQV